MTPEIKTKEKLLALLLVIFLFLTVGSLLFSISLNNKEKTITLKNRVIEIKTNRENIEKLNRIQLATTTLPEITSKAYLTLAITSNGTKKVLLEKNPDLVLPIASITKLMVAVIALENSDKEAQILATTDYIGKDFSAFILEDLKYYKLKELLANALIPSDNDSARLLSSVLGEEDFIAKMNLKAKEIGMSQTSYVNVTGLDQITPDASQAVNVSTVNDLSKLIIYIQKRHPEIFKLTTNSQYDICDINNYCKNVVSTNKLLTDPNFKYKIIGGKTGTTDLAGKNLALDIEAFEGVSLINIVLGSEDNFQDTTSLINQLIIN